MESPTAVLLLAYGSPATPDDVEAYFTHIRGGRKPSSEAVENLRARYEAIGGRTPLTDLTMRTGDALQAMLDVQARGAYRVYVAMKHWHPFIPDVAARIIADDVRRVIAIVLAPHYSRMSVGSYREALERAFAQEPSPPELVFVEQWHLQPEFIELIAERVREGLASFAPDERSGVRVIFSAHSLPERIRTWNDPYEAQLLASCSAVAAIAGVRDWRFAWQSAGHTGEPWLGPDLCDYLQTLHDEGTRSLLSVPIGFVCDHLEVLYDIDHEAASFARQLEMTLRRTRMPNDTPKLISTLSAIVAEAERTTSAKATSIVCARL